MVEAQRGPGGDRLCSGVWWEFSVSSARGDRTLGCSLLAGTSGFVGVLSRRDLVGTRGLLAPGCVFAERREAVN